MVRLDVGGASDAGRIASKQENQDTWASQEIPLGHLLVVCDGMGGQSQGLAASRTALRTILGALSPSPQGQGASPSEELTRAIRAASAAVFDLGQAGQDSERPGTTVVAAIITSDGVTIAHAGDSRAYLARGGQLFPLTRDHSVVEKLIEGGVLQRSDAINHPEAHLVTSALGLRRDVEIAVRTEPLPLFPGDVLFLCSDGITDMIPEDVLGRYTAHPMPAQALALRLVEVANEAGGHDNATIVIARPISNEPQDVGPTLTSEAHAPVDEPVGTLAWDKAPSPERYAAPRARADVPLLLLTVAAGTSILLLVVLYYVFRG